MIPLIPVIMAAGALSVGIILYGAGAAMELQELYDGAADNIHEREQELLSGRYETNAPPNIQGAVITSSWTDDSIITGFVITCNDLVHTVPADIPVAGGVVFGLNSTHLSDINGKTGLCGNSITLELLTKRGNLFEIVSPDRDPTTDVVSTPYIEYQRVGGLVANGNQIVEAAQYNHVGAGVTYIIDDWGDSLTYGIPNWAPLQGVMRLSPVPHLYLGQLYTTPPGIEAVNSVEVIAGDVRFTNTTDATHGKYHKFAGTGRVMVHLNDNNNHFVIHMVCPDCHEDTPAVIGGIPTTSGTSDSTSLGTGIVSSGTSFPCTINGITHPGCGLHPVHTNNREWPLRPVPKITLSHVENPGINGTVLHITNYNTCPGAAHDNTILDSLNSTHFRLLSNGCIMKNYSYEWWDGDIKLYDSLPIRPGLSTWQNPSGHNPTIILNMRGGQILLQIWSVTQVQYYNDIFNPTFTITPRTGDNTKLFVIHDAMAHLGVYAISDLHDMKNHVQTYPQLLKNGTVYRFSHSPGMDKTGGLLGHDCMRGFKYCMTVFNAPRLPSVNNAQGIVYDTRNAIELNRDALVHNRNNVFTTNNPTPGEVKYDSTTLELIQAYGVIPITGGVKVDELYIIPSFHSNGCDRYIDKTTSPHTWTASMSHSGWLRLQYLETHYGRDNPSLNVPLLPNFGTLCMRTHGNEEFRQFKMDDFFIQGSAASFGGTKHTHTVTGTLSNNPTTGNISVLDTDVTLLGSGTTTMDLAVDMAGRVVISGVVDNGGSAPDGNGSANCNWSNNKPPRSAPLQKVTLFVTVNVNVPGSNDYNEQFFHEVPLSASPAPTSVGEDCRHVSIAEFQYPAEFKTIPLTYGSNADIKVTVETKVVFAHGSSPLYAGGSPTETLYVETILEQLTLVVNN